MEFALPECFLGFLKLVALVDQPGIGFRTCGTAGYTKQPQASGNDKSGNVAVLMHHCYEATPKVD